MMTKTYVSSFMAIKYYEMILLIFFCSLFLDDRQFTLETVHYLLLCVNDHLPLEIINSPCFNDIHN